MTSVTRPVPSRRRFMQQASLVFAAAQLSPWFDVVDAAETDTTVVAETALGKVRGRVVRDLSTARRAGSPSRT